ncbi:MAG TPA: hypothetical protein VGM66_06185 [Candidatus Udaeobacter sp.]
MLDSATYRVNEQLAKASLPAWQIAQTHNVDHFEKVGFPVRINSVQDLGPLLDTMQENRFEKYMTELGGLTPQEYVQVIEACRHSVLFQLNFFPGRQPVLPASTLLSVFCLYKKLRGVNPSFRSVLEIGPGCGYLSYFLRHHHALENYSQIEACESFYILQNLVNLHCFGPDFAERAFMPAGSDLSNHYSVPNAVTEFAPFVHLSRAEPRCTHYPWWRIGELTTRNIKFDIVTSNANLLEFSQAALRDYLSLVHQVLAPQGAFVVQCMGYPSHGSIQSLIEKFRETGFALLAMPQENLTTPPPKMARPSNLLTELKGETMQSDPVVFTVNNALLVKAGHPLYEKYRDPRNYRMEFVGDEPLVNDVFFSRPSQRQMYPLRQFIEDTERGFRREPVEVNPALPGRA